MAEITLTPRAPTVWVRPRQANNSQTKERGQTREQHCMRPTLQDLRHPHFGGSQAPQEVGCFQRETAANLASQDHQTGPPIVTNQLGVPGLLATPSNCEARTADSCCSWSGFAFLGQWANQRGVHCQLCSTKQRQPVHHDFQPPCVEGVEGAQVHVANENIRPHSASSLSADPCSCRESLDVPAAQQQNTPTDGGQGRRKDGHIGKRDLRVEEGDGGGAGEARKDWGSKRELRSVGKQTNGLTQKALLGTSRGLRQDLTE